MTSEQITNTKEVKIKNPKRVAQGKRLALISADAKKQKKEWERIGKEKLETEIHSNESSQETEGSTGVVVGVAVLGVVGAGALYWWKCKSNKVEPVVSDKSVASERKKEVFNTLEKEIAPMESF